MLRGKLLKQRIKRLSALLLFIFFVVGSVAAWQFGEELEVFGEVTYLGESNVTGLKVKAFIGKDEVASCETENGRYRLVIPKDDPATAAREGWADGDFVEIRVNGRTAARFFVSSETKKKEIDLNISTLDVNNLTTWGKIKALFK